jgi:hypothetical protein
MTDMADVKEKGLTLGSHQFPVFDGASAAFGARGKDYPDQSVIPEKFRRGHTPYNRVVSTLFFKGGKLDDFGLSFKKGIDRNQAMTAIRALLCSFDPKHEIKEATVAWALSEWCDGEPIVS